MFSIIFIFYFPKGTLCSYFSVVKISMIYIHILFCSFLPTLFICENISLSKGQSILHQCQTLPSLTGTFFHNMYVSVLNSNTEFFFQDPTLSFREYLLFWLFVQRMILSTQSGGSTTHFGDQVDKNSTSVLCLTSWMYTLSPCFSPAVLYTTNRISFNIPTHIMSYLCIVKFFECTTLFRIVYW